MIKKFLTGIAVVFACASSFSGMAQGVDSEGYPVFYLRGAELGSNWDTYDQYRFVREGEHYSISLDKLNGKFKISNSDWTRNYGASGGSELSISSSVVVYAHADGPDFVAGNLENITISFDYVTPGSDHPSDLNITFQIGDAPVTVPGLSGTLPVLYINVYNEDGSLNNEITDYNLNHKEYFAGKYWFDINGCEWAEKAGYKSIGSQAEPLDLEIKGRGNWTLKGFSKKPFKLKLGSKQSLLGLSKSKHYAILAHADDSYGFLRNYTGFNLGRRMGLPWTPSQQPIEVVINGNYRGLYHLTESIRIGDGRVPITELDDNVSDPALVSGGYLVELDNYDEENQIRMEEKGLGDYFRDMLRITFDTPEVYSELQYKYIEDQFTAMNDAVGANSDDLWSYIDMDDLARYYLAREITSDVEAFHGSTYMFRDRGEGQKWHFSPIWDCGNAFNGPTDGFFYDHSPFGNTWIPSIRQNARFNAKVAETWKWFMANCYDGIEADIRDYASRINAAATADYARWENAPVPDGGVGVCDNRDMDQKVSAVLYHLDKKTEWLKGQFGDYSGSYAEPVRDTTPAAALPDYIQSGVKEIESVPIVEDAEIFSLQGIRVAEMQPGQVYIIVNADGRACKVMR